MALLFSDPTGSGVDAGLKVLVQGIAEVDDRDLEANRERYARESVEKLPATKKMHPPKFVRGMLDWYYARIYVKVRPERVLIWRDGRAASEPELLDAHLEEVRSGHCEEPPSPHAPAAGGATAWDERIDELGERYETAVLSWVGARRLPALRAASRCRSTVDGRRIALGAEPAGLPLTEGRACLTAHTHAPDFTWQENFQVRGDLVATERGWALVPHKLVGGFEIPKGTIARSRSILSGHRRFYRTAKRRLAERDARA